MRELQNGNTPALFNDKPNQDLFERVYGGISDIREQSPATFKGTEIWSWIANQINGADDKQEMAESVIKMFHTMRPLLLLSIQTAKRDGNKSKEVVVKDYLDTALAELS